MTQTSFFKASFVVLCFFCLCTTSTYAQYKETCLPSSESCQYYLCIEQELQCGAKGYLKYFGHYYCETYLKHSSKLSTFGELWLYRARLCLQQKIEQIAFQARDCQDLHQLAITSHVDCYVSTGYCQLVELDQFKIKAIAAQELFRSGRVIDSLRTLVAINRQCAQK